MKRKHEQHRLANLEILVKEAGSLSRLARLGNTSASYLSQVRHQLMTVSGTPRSVGDVLASKLEQAMGKPHGWMDERQDYVKEPDTRARYRVRKSTSDLRALHPLISWVQAGEGGSLAAKLALPSAETLLPCPVHCSRDTYVLQVAGQSMEPKFHDGDLLFVDPEATTDYGRYVVVKPDDSPEATFRQLILEGERRYLKALNPDWPNRIIEIDESAKICGVVVFTGKVL